jgi:hypothetical protein
MATDLSTELASFHEFIGQQLQSGESLSPEQALSLWRERAETVAALYEGLQAVEDGRTKPLEQFVREFADRHGLPADA